MRNFSKIVVLLCCCLLFGLHVDAQTATSADKKVIVTNENTINSTKLEFSPAFYEDGIVFISSRVSKKRYSIKDKRIDTNIMSIWRSKRSEEGSLLTPETFDENLLSPVHEGPITLDRTADRIFFTRNNIVDGKRQRSSVDKILKLQIFSTEREGEGWGNIYKLPFNNKDYNYAHPAISVDGDAIYFSSDQPGGFGGMDLYVSRKVGEEWGEPINLGSEINSEDDEVFPYIHADGTLYFASNGHSGFGGLDIFYALQKNARWGKPENIGKPFNSDKDDFGFIVDRDKKNGYFSSNRKGGLGEDDIYSYYVTTNLDEVADIEKEDAKYRELKMLVVDGKTGDPVPSATIRYMNLNEMTIAQAITGLDRPENEQEDIRLSLSMQKNAQQAFTNEVGKQTFPITNSNYVFNIAKQGYEPRLVVVTAESDMEEIMVSLKEFIPGQETAMGPGGKGTDESGTSSSDSSSSSPTLADLGIADLTIKEGTIFELPNIYYNFNDAAIRPDARVDLNALADFLNLYTDIHIELSSHTDSRGTNRYNQRLSQKRAENAAQYLVENGISRERIHPVGYGENRIRNQCTDGVECSEAEHQYNRRTEVLITKMNREINIKFIQDVDPPSVVDKADWVNGGGNARASRKPSGVFTVIAGVFRNKDNAEGRLSEVQSAGFPNAKISRSGSLYKVIVQEYTDESEARSVANNLENEHKINTFVKL